MRIVDVFSASGADSVLTGGPMRRAGEVQFAAALSSCYFSTVVGGAFSTLPRRASGSTRIRLTIRSERMSYSTRSTRPPAISWVQMRWEPSSSSLYAEMPPGRVAVASHWRVAPRRPPAHAQPAEGRTG